MQIICSFSVATARTNATFNWKRDLNQFAEIIFAVRQCFYLIM